MIYSSIDMRKYFIFYSDSLEKIYKDYNTNNYLLLNDSINYYIGLIEIVIFCLNIYGFRKKYFYLEELYYSNYLKKIFFNSNYKEFNINLFLNKYKLDYVFLVILLIYPDYYIDAVYENINYNDDSLINNIIKRREEYVDYVKYIINEILKIKEYHNNDILNNIIKLF